MATWKKKIEAGGGGDLRPGEVLVGGIFLQPDGTTGAMMSKELGGVVGAAVAQKRRGPDAVADGIATVLPDTACWLGLTPSRLLVWSHGAMRGRPKQLLTELPANDLRSVELTKRKTTHAVVLEFADGSTRRYEAPKLANDAEAFAAAVNSR